jgi:hypothetical protein
MSVLLLVVYTCITVIQTRVNECFTISVSDN